MELDLSEVPCTKCQLPGGLRIEMRTDVQAKPLGSHSMARSIKFTLSSI